MSFMQGASPMSMPEGSYFFRMDWRPVICWFTASLATRYSELMSHSCHLSLSTMLRTLSGSTSAGTRLPSTLCRLST